MQYKMKKDIRNIAVHASAVLVGYLMALMVINIQSENKFKSRQDAAVYATNDHSRDAELNRDIFSSDTFKDIKWTYYTNQRIGETYGETAAKEYVMDIERTTRNQTHVDASDDCAERIVQAYRDAASRLGFRRDNKRALPFPEGRCDTLQVFQNAMDDAKYFVKYFESDSVPNAIIKNPLVQDLANISSGSIICKGRHCYMYMGIGYIDQTGRTFVANTRGRPVIASCDDKRLFKYFDWSKCTIIDVPKIAEYKLQNDVQRHVR